MVKLLTNIGLYIHIPFCQKKCAYCDFYSAIITDSLIDSYVSALKRDIKQWGGYINRPIDTIYFGGGTPSLLGKRLIPLLECIKNNFKVCSDAEITLEVNPQKDIENVLKSAKQAGVNRLSIGAQSGIDSELLTLGRTHTKSDTKNAVALARNLGFSNISLDLMIGLPHSTTDTLKQNLDFLLGLNPEHISAYILKIEPKTLFFKERETLNLPDEDAVCDQYLYMCDYLENSGFSHYEISNFSKEKKESRHNLKYWKCEEYLGLGPSAHSFLDGKRFYFERDLKGYINGAIPTPDGDGGNDNEKLMLGLRLKDGVDYIALPKNKADLFIKNGLATKTDGRFHLTNKGFLISNAIIGELI
ncbi:MAG: radical SAM family heme chaperone HemW [Clostridia bacterium]|nr:radical SAM family heme chaperone HemW [Clostridia bacterium]